MGDYSAYITGWLVGYSGLLGPVAGVMIADYFIVRRLPPCSSMELYLRDGAYEYSGGGFNYRAHCRPSRFGILIALIGLVAPGSALALQLRLVRRILASGALYTNPDMLRRTISKEANA